MVWLSWVLKTRRSPPPRRSTWISNDFQWIVKNFFRSLDKLSSDFHVSDCTWIYCCVTNKLDWIDVLFRVGLHQLEVLGGDLKEITGKCIQPKVRSSLYFSGKFLYWGRERAVIFVYYRRFVLVCLQLLIYLLALIILHRPISLHKFDFSGLELTVSLFS